MEDGSIFRFLDEATDSFRKEFQAGIRSMDLPAGHVLVHEEDTCEFLPIVARGSLRVFKSAPGGREITLYHIEKGQSCILTAFSILNARPFPAEATTAEPSQVFLIHRSQFRRWMDISPPFRDYIFALLQERLFSALITVSEVAFKRTDLRLMEYLVDRAGEGQGLQITHQKLAGEIGTAREVVSRILKDLEREGLIETTRGAILLVRPDDLREKIAKNSSGL